MDEKTTPTASRHAWTLEVGAPFLGQRLDQALTAALQARGEAVTRSRVLQAFALDQVRCQGRPCKASTRLDAPLQIEVVIPELPPLAYAHAQDLGLVVIFEDEHLLIVDKPPHMAVHGGPGHDEGTLVNAVLHHLHCQPSDLPTLAGNGPERPGIVHRLDRDTSGVMVVAKSLVAQEGLAQLFRAHTMRREYLGIVRGAPRLAHERISSWHGRDPRERKRYAPTVNEGRKAITELTLEKQFDQASLLRFRLHTGRTHQIRMHCKMLGHPIIGDELYGNPARSPEGRAMVAAIGRQALHAAVLELVHPVSGQTMLFEAPLPADFCRLLALVAQPGPKVR